MTYAHIKAMQEEAIKSLDEALAYDNREKVQTLAAAIHAFTHARQEIRR